MCDFLEAFIYWEEFNAYIRDGSVRAICFQFNFISVRSQSCEIIGEEFGKILRSNSIVLIDIRNLFKNFSETSIDCLSWKTVSLFFQKIMRILPTWAGGVCKSITTLSTHTHTHTHTHTLRLPTHILTVLVLPHSSSALEAIRGQNLIRISPFDFELRNGSILKRPTTRHLCKGSHIHHEIRTD
jgi:hypothetical protein